MGRPVRKIVGYTADEIKALFNGDELKALLKNENNHKIRLRLYAVYQVSKGKPSRQLAETCNTSFKQILNWVSRFEQHGLEGLKDKKGRGRKSLLTDQQHLFLKELILTEKPSAYGYSSPTWTGPLLNDWISKKWGVFYKKAQIYNIIKSLGLTYQKSKGFYLQADPSPQEEFKTG